MAKGDKSRTQNKIDEQQKMSQGYLTGVQQGLGNQSGNLSNAYFGPNAPTYGSTFGYGSTVPHYSYTNQPYYSGSGTDKPTPTYQSGGGGSAQNWDQGTFENIFGRPGTPQALEALEPEMAKYGISIARNAAGVAGKIKLPNGQIVDVIQSAGTGGGPNNFQWLTGPGGGAGGIMGQSLADYGNIMNQYQDWAKTGGFSQEDLANIRARSVSPVRAAYSNAQREMERGRALQGGYSPGFNAATARMAREQGQLGSDMSTNTEAMIAELLQRGKLAGMGGMTSMYGATPGLANTFGQQMLQSQGQNLQAAGLQNQLGLGIMGAQNQQAQVPGNWQQAMNNIAGLGGAAQGIGGALYPWLG